MDIFNFLVIITIAANLFLGYLVFTRGAKNKITFSLASLAFIGGIWGILLYLYHSPIIFSSLLWIKIVYLIVFFVVFNLFYFSLIFPYRIQRSIFLPSFLYFIFSIPLLYTLFFTKLWVRDVIYKTWGPETILGPVYIIVAIFWTFFGIWTLYNLTRKYSISTGLNKERIKYILIGMSFFIFIVATVDGVIPILTGNTQYFRISPLSSLFFVGFTAYAILRYRLMDIRLVVRTGLVYFLSIATLIAGVVGAIYFFSWLVDYTPNIRLAVIGVIAMAILLLIFIPLKDFLLRLANKYLFKTVYSIQEALRGLSKKAATIIELDKLIKAIVETIKKAFGLKNVSLLFKEKEVFTIKENVGFKEEDISTLTKEKLLLASLEEKRKPLLLEEIETGGKLGNLREKMEEMNISLILPLFSKKELAGLVILGPKVANEAYTKEDIELLETLSSQAAIAIENARLYQAVKDLTENLEQRVKEQTKNIEALSEMKSEFLKIVNHQLRTPTTIIMSLLSMLQEGSIKGEERIKETLNKAYLSSQRLITILDDILNAQELVGERPGLNLQPCKIEDIILKTLIHFEFAASQKNLILTFEKPEKPLPQILMDEERIERVLKKLIDNAILYTERGSITIAANLVKEDKKDFIEIKVRDTGIGLTKEGKGKLFKIFSRGEGIKLHPNGSGLGLYIAKEYIEAHRGKIEAQSEGRDKGSIFIITLPVITEV